MYLNTQTQQHYQKFLTQLYPFWIGWFLAFILTLSYCYLHGFLMQHPVTSWTHSSLWSLSIWLPWALLLPFVSHLRSRCGFYASLIVLTSAALCGKIILNLWLFSEVDVVLIIFRYWPIELLIAWLLLTFLSQQKNTQSDVEEVQTKEIQAPYAYDLPVCAESILYVSAARNYVELFTADQNHLMRTTLTEIFEWLEPHGFIRTHRSHIINPQALSHIKKIRSRSHKAVLHNGQYIPVSQQYLKHLQHALQN